MNPSGNDSRNFQTRAVHSGRGSDPSTGAVSLPLHTSTTFERDPDGEFSRGFAYIRESNPNRNALESCVADLEGGVEAVAYGSGCGASFGVFQCLAPGDHVVLHRDVYFGVRAAVEGVFARWGLEHTFLDMRDGAELRRVLRPTTKLLWLETPSNPLLEVVDIRQAVEAAHSVGALAVCENTFASPALQQPLALGADLVVHSLTKYLAGHSDSMGGAVVVRERGLMLERLRDFQQTGGAVLSPFDCWLTLRGVQTLGPRMRAHCENAMLVARFLERHPAVTAVHYPGLESDPGHEIARRQMSGFGGMMSFEVRGGRAEAFAVAARLRTITRATSLGGTHSLIEHRASIEGPQTRAPESLLRLSVGIEDGNDLVNDLAQALEAI